MFSRDLPQIFAIGRQCSTAGEDWWESFILEMLSKSSILSEVSGNESMMAWSLATKCSHIQISPTILSSTIEVRVTSVLECYLHS